MPPYAHLADDKVDYATTPAKMQAMRTVGVPYTDAQIASAIEDARAQGQAVAKDLAEGGVKVDPDSKMVATIAYLQRLGQKPQPKKPAEVAHAP
jgi:cytochrome c oxidase cbb3-type subunit I/II